MVETLAEWTSERIDEANTQLTGKSALERLEWARGQFDGHLILSTSFGIQSAVMLHLATQVDPDIPVVFIDTGYLFKETYLFARELTERLGLNLKKYQPLISPAEQEALYGKLWESSPEDLAKYNHIRKVEPMNRAVKELDATAWLVGLRRSQSSTRQDLAFVQQQQKTIKVHPILDWTDRDVYRYLTAHDLPYHPLWEQGYVSVGDTHSTRPFLDGLRPEDTRFSGMKRECGLHEVSDLPDYQI